MQIELYNQWFLFSKNNDEQDGSDSSSQPDDDHLQESETSTKDGGDQAQTK